MVQASKLVVTLTDELKPIPDMESMKFGEVSECHTSDRPKVLTPFA